MPIKSPNAPKLRHDLHSLELLKIAKRGLTHRVDSITGDLCSDLTFTDPHRNYFVGLESILRNHLLREAEAKSWSYLMMAKPLAGGELEFASKRDDKGEDVIDRFLAIHFCTEAAPMLVAFRAAERLPDVALLNFEFRFIHNPSVDFHAIWLHSDSKDILLPTRDVVDELKQGNAYTETEALWVLQPLAVLAKSGQLKHELLPD